MEYLCITGVLYVHRLLSAFTEPFADRGLSLYMWVNQLLEMCYGHVRTVQCVWTFFSGGVLCVHCYMTLSVLLLQVRKVEYKDKMEEEWERFQKSMKEESHVSNLIKSMKNVTCHLLKVLKRRVQIKKS